MGSGGFGWAGEDEGGSDGQVRTRRAQMGRWGPGGFTRAGCDQDQEGSPGHGTARFGVPGERETEAGEATAWKGNGKRWEKRSQLPWSEHMARRGR